MLYLCRPQPASRTGCGSGWQKAISLPPQFSQSSSWAGADNLQFYRWGNRGTEQVHALYQISAFIKNGVEIPNREFWFQSPSSELANHKNCVESNQLVPGTGFLRLQWKWMCPRGGSEMGLIQWIWGGPQSLLLPAHSQGLAFGPGTIMGEPLIHNANQKLCSHGCCLSHW